MMENNNYRLQVERVSVTFVFTALRNRQSMRVVYLSYTYMYAAAYLYTFSESRITNYLWNGNIYYPALCVDGGRAAWPYYLLYRMMPVFPFGLEIRWEKNLILRKFLLRNSSKLPRYIKCH